VKCAAYCELRNFSAVRAGVKNIEDVKATHSDTLNFLKTRSRRANATEIVVQEDESD